MDRDRLALLSFTENSGYLWPFGMFHEKNLYRSLNDSFLKKVCPKQVFSACENGAFGFFFGFF